MLQEQLKQAERHVVTGAFRIARQRELISELKRNGYTELAARGGQLLVSFNELQALSIDHLARLQRKLVEA
jgi:hypothetical protein